MFIDGESCAAESGETFAVLAPETDAEIGKVPKGREPSARTEVRLGACLVRVRRSAGPDRAMDIETAYPFLLGIAPDTCV